MASVEHLHGISRRNVIKRLVRRRWTQTDLAERIGCDRTHVTRALRRAPRDLPLRTLGTFARALDCEPWELLRGE